MMNPSITIVIDMTTGRRRVQKNPPEDPPPPQDTSERLQCIVCFKDLNNSRVILICVISAPKLVFGEKNYACGARGELREG